VPQSTGPTKQAPSKQATGDGWQLVPPLSSFAGDFGSGFWTHRPPFHLHQLALDSPGQTKVCIPPPPWRRRASHCCAATVSSSTGERVGLGCDRRSGRWCKCAAMCTCLYIRVHVFWPCLWALFFSFYVVERGGCVLKLLETPSNNTPINTRHHRRLSWQLL